METTILEKNDVIYIKKINNRWRVWLGDKRQLHPLPAKCDARFPDFDDARDYAEDWASRSYVKDVKNLTPLGEQA
jgi:hypothetical protein